MSALSVKDISVTFNGTPAVDGVSCDLSAGSLVGLIGPNGAGKTTLLRAIAQLIPFEGRMLLDGEDLTAMSRAAIAKSISYLAQGHISHWPLQARNVVALGRQPHLSPWGRMSTTDKNIIDDAMHRADVEQFAERNVLTLSGGERARVMLARALAVDANILLADEPVASLDPFHQLKIMELLKDLAGAGKTIIGVTHDLTLAARFCDQLILLAEGKMISHGGADDVLTDSKVADAYHVNMVRAAHDEQSYVLPWKRL
jgi:iron complex transport system ATP-binding protein